jgi:hypothetical protein
MHSQSRHYISEVLNFTLGDNDSGIHSTGGSGASLLSLSRIELRYALPMPVLYRMNYTNSIECNMALKIHLHFSIRMGHESGLF